MNGDDLKAMQAPLKDQYKTDPASALITLRARGRATDGIACHLMGEDFHTVKQRRGFPTPPLRRTYAATDTLILFGLTSSRIGSRTVSTPALY